MSQDNRRNALGRIWQEVLQTPNVDDNDDFFEAGGDSLAAAKMTGLARKAGVPLRASDVLRNPRFGDLVLVTFERDS